MVNAVGTQHCNQVGRMGELVGYHGLGAAPDLVTVISAPIARVADRGSSFNQVGGQRCCWRGFHAGRVCRSRKRWKAEMEFAGAGNEEFKRAEENGSDGGGRRVDVELSYPIRAESEGGKDKALAWCEVACHDRKSDLESVSGRHRLCLARQLTVQKTTSFLCTVESVAGSTKGDRTQRVYLGSSPHG